MDWRFRNTIQEEDDFRPLLATYKKVRKHNVWDLNENFTFVGFLEL